MTNSFRLIAWMCIRDHADPSSDACEQTFRRIAGEHVQVIAMAFCLPFESMDSRPLRSRYRRPVLHSGGDVSGRGNLRLHSTILHNMAERLDIEGDNRLCYRRSVRKTKRIASQFDIVKGTRAISRDRSIVRFNESRAFKQDIESSRREPTCGAVCRVIDPASSPMMSMLGAKHPA
jgi:hypothetical protein